MNKEFGNCPDCGVKLSKLIQPRPKYSKLATALFILGGIVTLVWLGIISSILNKMEVIIIGKIMTFIGLLPGLLLALYAVYLPKLKTTKCHKCSWSDTTRLKRDQKARGM